MENLLSILKHPREVYPLLKLKVAVKLAQKQTPQKLLWSFCYSNLNRLSKSFSLVIQRLDPALRDTVCVFYLATRALDTIEDDTSIDTDVKVPVLTAFHQHIYDLNWRFSCGTKDSKVLMDEFHFVSAAFSELDRSYQEIIEDNLRRMGAGMAKFICNEVKTVDDYDEYCHYVAGVLGMGLSKLFCNSGFEDLAPDNLSNSVGLLLQKTNIIRDYLEDINEIPKSRVFWPREIWGKYVEKLEYLKYEENSDKSIQCLNEMVTNALFHAEDCLEYLSALQSHHIFRSCAIPLIIAIGTLALCYHNIQVFRGVVKIRPGLQAMIFDQTETMSDVYGAFYDFADVIKLKVDKNDPNAARTLDRIEAIQRVCRESCNQRKRKLFTTRRKGTFLWTPIRVAVFVVVSAILAQVYAS